MPKVYSEEERQEIIKRLHKAGEEGIKRYGVKKTTVDYLVKTAGIPKGTFYLFYESKELLLFEIIMEVHEEIEQDFFKDVAALKHNMNIDTLTDVFLRIFKRCEESCILRMLTGDDMQVLAEKLPPEVLAAHMESDTDNVEKLKLFFPQMESKEAETIAGAFRGLFILLVQKKQIGEAYFYDSMRLLIRGILLQLIGKQEEENE